MAWALDRIPDLAGRVALVTGANSGIGFKTARASLDIGPRRFWRAAILIRPPGLLRVFERKFRRPNSTLCRLSLLDAWRQPSPSFRHLLHILAGP